MSELPQGDDDPLRQILARSRRVYSQAQVQQAVDAMARMINNDFAGQTLVLLCVMIGAVPFTAALMQQLTVAVELDYIHASRYGKALSGGELEWLALPRTKLTDRAVLVVDDIFDEGYTMRAIVNYCRQQHARVVKTAALIDKHHQRKVPDLTVDYLGLPVDDIYVYGFGMDCEGWGRNLGDIYALNQTC